MRKLVFHRRFEKQYALLNSVQKVRVKVALTQYMTGKITPALRVHKLSGEYRGQVSISAGGDLRIHLLDNEIDMTVVALQVGTHSQLYG